MLPSSLQSIRALSAFVHETKLQLCSPLSQSLENNSGTLMLGAVPCCLTFGSLPFFPLMQLWKMSCIWILVHISGCFLKVGFLGERMICLGVFLNEPARTGVEMGEVPIGLIGRACIFPCFLSSVYARPLLYLRYILSTSTLSCAAIQLSTSAQWLLSLVMLLYPEAIKTVRFLQRCQPS